jgi:hypothetical protein
MGLYLLSTLALSPHLLGVNPEKRPICPAHHSPNFPLFLPRPWSRWDSVLRSISTRVDKLAHHGRQSAYVRDFAAWTTTRPISICYPTKKSNTCAPGRPAYCFIATAQPLTAAAFSCIMQSRLRPSCGSWVENRASGCWLACARTGCSGVFVCVCVCRHLCRLALEFGYLHERHPDKLHNYYQSWQELTQVTDPALALQAIITRFSDRFDSAWWGRPTDLNAFHNRAPANPNKNICNLSPAGNVDLTNETFNDPSSAVLMTRFTFPAFKWDPRDGKSYLRFPRIAYDPPMARNGFRRFTLGNGEVCAFVSVTYYL